MSTDAIITLDTTTAVTATARTATTGTSTQAPSAVVETNATLNTVDYGPSPGGIYIDSEAIPEDDDDDGSKPITSNILLTFHPYTISGATFQNEGSGSARGTDHSLVEPKHTWGPRIRWKRQDQKGRRLLKDAIAFGKHMKDRESSNLTKSSQSKDLPFVPSGYYVPYMLDGITTRGLQTYSDQLSDDICAEHQKKRTQKI